MKIINFYSLILLVAVFLCGSLTACSNDDDDNGKEKEEEVKTTGQLDLLFSYGDDLLLLADVEVVFINTDGKKTTEKVTAFPWKKTITFDKVPVTAGYKVNFTPKSGVELTKDVYELSEVFNNSFSVFQEDKKVSMKSLANATGTLSLPKDKVEEYLEKKLSSKVYAYKVDANYSCDKTELSFE